jgi:DNA-binding response OmpR family regulator
MTRRRILWADDEIDILKPHIIFLQEHGYDVTGVTNGNDALDLVKKERFDVVLLDEMMAGMDGLTTLEAIKAHDSSIPCVMITKNEEESLMEEAIGSKIDDYLTKPVNPSQILLACKKIIDAKAISGQKLAQDYITKLREYSNTLSNNPTWQDFIDIYVSLTEIEIELQKFPDLGLGETIADQKLEFNAYFGQFVEDNYPRWVRGEDAPVMSPQVVRKYVIPELRKGKRVLFLVIDCLRLDQWMVIEEHLRDYFNIRREHYYSILPSATPYSRNAIFAGMYPSEIEATFPRLWERGVADESSANRYEHQFLDRQLQVNGIQLKPEHKYIKVMDSEESLNVARKVGSFLNHPFVSMVWNFVDILAHSRSSSDVLKEMVPDEAAYRSVIGAWFLHSSLLRILKTFGNHNTTIVVTTDHGSIRGKRGTRVVSDREAATSLRYKFGRNLKADPRHAIYVRDPHSYKLPQITLNNTYIMAREDYYFVYPTNYNKYLNLYRDSFQHGGDHIGVRGQGDEFFGPAANGIDGCCRVGVDAAGYQRHMDVLTVKTGHQIGNVKGDIDHQKVSAIARAQLHQGALYRGGVGYGGTAVHGHFGGRGEIAVQAANNHQSHKSSPAAYFVLFVWGGRCLRLMR